MSLWSPGRRSGCVLATFRVHHLAPEISIGSDVPERPIHWARQADAGAPRGTAPNRWCMVKLSSDALSEVPRVATDRCARHLPLASRFTHGGVRRRLRLRDGAISSSEPPNAGRTRPRAAPEDVSASRPGARPSYRRTTHRRTAGPTRCRRIDARRHPPSLPDADGRNRGMLRARSCLGRPPGGARPSGCRPSPRAWLRPLLRRPPTAGGVLQHAERLRELPHGRSRRRRLVQHPHHALEDRVLSSLQLPIVVVTDRNHRLPVPS